MLTSALFANDPLLEQIAVDANHQRISTTQNRHHPAVVKVQKALLIWDPNCLPGFGADGDYGSETAGAVLRFKIEVIGVQGQVFNDVGPQTVRWLDAIALAHEQNLAREARIAELDGWLTPALSGIFSSVTTSNLTVHVSGTEAFASLHAALSACAGGRALILIAGWDFQEQTAIIPGVTIRDALSAAASRGVQVRAIFNHFPVISLPVVGEWRPLPGNNIGPVTFINQLPGGAAIHDDRVLHYTAGSLGINIGGLPINLIVQLGVHHQKAWVVWTGEQLFAWCGGIDLNANRTGPNALHDITVELTGLAAAQVYEVLRKRWEDNPNHPSGVILPTLSPASVAGTHRCRVVTTFGDPTQFSGLNSSPYSFAPAGSKAYHMMLSHLISKARNFIYVEDQYFVDEQIGQELAANMAHINGLIILICDSNMVNGELHQAYARRRAVFNHLLPHANKVAVVIRRSRFVHAKTWIFDDTIALVGSANINRRGLEHDSEMGIAFGDIQGIGSARQMRERLWAMHLGTAFQLGSDPVGALSQWKNPPAGSDIAVYDWTVGTDGSPIPLPAIALGLSRDQMWGIVDPSCP